MSQVSIHIEHLSKQYTIGQKEPYKTFRDTIAKAVNESFNSLMRTNVAEPVESRKFWALRDITLDIEEGEIVGIVGRNGAGKSTLLKVLSRITSPTDGYAEVHGRIGSLLEVGTGFHPELTGRENIYLSGAILGMSRAEINSKFNEIVEFAGMGRFIDTPIKRYSSGMNLRLGFAVAAHLDTEILMVDEVLAVGDASFQKKCLGKMSELTKEEGKTVLFVSHNMNAVNRLCKKCIWLDAGKLVDYGDTKSIIEKYIRANVENGAQINFSANPDKRMQFRAIRVIDQDGNIASNIPDNQTATIECDIEVKDNIKEDVYFGLTLQNSEGINVLFADSRDVDNKFPTQFLPGNYTISIRIPPLLAPGFYYVSMGISTVSMMPLDYYETVCSLNLVNYDSQRIAVRPGFVNMRLPWTARNVKKAVE